MSRWADLFAALSGAYDTSDTSRRIESASSEVSRCVRNVSALPGGQSDTGELAGEAPEPAANWSDAAEERAAIIEFEAAVPRAWAEGFARLHPDRPPAAVPPGRWRQFVDDCGRFLDGGFAETAAALGWGPYDLFGCDRERPFVRVDQAGLIWLLNGARLVALTAETAVVEMRPGVRQVYRRGDAPGRVLPWEPAP